MSIEKRHSWTFTEDARLSCLVKIHGTHDWLHISSRMQPLATVDAKQCRERWCNHLAPGIRKTPLSPTEKDQLIVLQSQLGNQWTKISKKMPGRTANQLKNFWYGMKRKRQRIEEDSDEDDSSWSDEEGPRKRPRLETPLVSTADTKEVPLVALPRVSQIIVSVEVAAILLSLSGPGMDLDYQ